MKGSGEMVEVIMIIAGMFFFIGVSFNKVIDIAANEWQEARKEFIND